MTDDRKAKMLAKVRGLLAQADSTTHEGEREVFRAKADELMELYAIEEWQIESNSGEAARPERRYYDFRWWLKHPQRESLWFVFSSAASAARCKVVHHDDRHHNGVYSISVLGLPADLDYLDLLFTSLMMQMTKEILPEYDPARSLDENVYTMRMKGMGWPQIAEKLYVSGIVDVPRGHAEALTADGERRWRGLAPRTQQAIRSRLAARYRAYAKGNGLPQNYVDPKVYQRSYAEGFADAVATRLWAMKRERTERHKKDSGSDNPFAVALRDIDAAIRAYYEELYADYLEAMKNAKKRKVSTAVDRRVRSYAAETAGAEAGRKADITTNGSKLGSRRFIES